MQPTVAPQGRDEMPALAPSPEAMSPDALIRLAVQRLSESEERQYALALTRPSPQAGLELSLTSQERRTSITVRELRRTLAEAQVPASVDAVVAHIAAWAARRPVSDQEARSGCVATLRWAGPNAARTLAAAGAAPSLRWQIVSADRLHTTPLPWLPASTTTKSALAQIRRAALARAASLAVTPISAGDVVVWTFAPHPGLSSAVLAAPDQVAATSARLLKADPATLWMVAAPDRPVAVAARAAAYRLSQETSAAHVCAPLLDCSRVGW